MKRKMDKDFDCVEMKRKLQEQLYEETKGMTPVEYGAYIRGRIANSRFASFLKQPERTVPVDK